MTVYKRLRGLVKKPLAVNREKDQNCKPPTTVRDIYLPGRDADESWCKLSDALVSEFEGKILKYFDVNENLSGFYLRSRALGLELRIVEGNKARGFVIIGNEGYTDRLIEMKSIYNDSYSSLQISKEFDNQLNRAGFYWEGQLL